MVVDEADKVLLKERERVKRGWSRLTIPRIELLHRHCKTVE
jgi:hypothetical protein